MTFFSEHHNQDCKDMKCEYVKKTIPPCHYIRMCTPLREYREEKVRTSEKTGEET